jgi:hypothetical protein
VKLSALADRQPTAAVTLDDLLDDFQRIADMPLDAAPGLLTELAGRQSQLAAVQAALAARLYRADASAERGDTLLTVEEAAPILSVSPDWLYRKARALPFTVRHGQLLRFSAHGIQSYIKQRRRT